MLGKSNVYTTYTTTQLLSGEDVRYSDITREPEKETVERVKSVAQGESKSIRVSKYQ